MSMDTIMEEYEYSFDSNTDAIVYGVSNPSRSDESMISAPNISSSSSEDDDDIIHQQQQQIPVAAAASGDGTDDLTVSSCASSSWFTDNNNNNNNKQIEQKAVMIFNVDFGELSRLAVCKSCDNEPIKDSLMLHGFWQDGTADVIQLIGPPQLIYRWKLKSQSDFTS
ncbi:uncharacterized protein LOC107020044 [Solanum pennellii]|uniref:Uncharacterized protein LOC107020044 n=1 Tax=Solanum pennellii TaxID=28526 RepID=A0ABM1GTQ8_SOLPN|nr:uncharacterized protein LOC107020044 [Solanum pennellii]